MSKVKIIMAKEQQATSKPSKYDKKKTTFFELLRKYSKDPDELNKVLLPLTKGKEGEGISTLGIVKAGVNAVGYGLKHAGRMLTTAAAVPFYQQEFSKLMKVLSGGLDDPTNPSFFIQLLKDTDSLKFLSKGGGENLSKLIETITPTLISLSLVELGKTEELQEKHKVKKAKLSSLEKEFNELQEKPGHSSKDESRMKELQAEIDSLKQSLKVLEKEPSAETANFIKELRQAGLNEGYIKQNLAPLVGELTKVLLKEQSQELLKILQLGVEIATTTSEKSKEALEQQIIDKGLKILQNPAAVTVLTTRLPQFLSAPETQNILGKVAEQYVGQQEDLKKYGITAEIVKDAVPLAAKLVSAVLPHQSELISIITTARELMSLPPEKAGEKSQKINSLVNSILQLKNKEGVKEIIDQELPEFLTKHAEQLGKSIDKFLQEEANLPIKTQGEKLVKLAAKKSPQLLEIADMYSKRQFVKLIPKVGKLLFDREVLSVILDVAVTMAKKKKEHLKTHPMIAKIRQTLSRHKASSALDSSHSSLIPPVSTKISRKAQSILGR